MAENKTAPTRVSPAAFIKGVTGGQRQGLPVLEDARRRRSRCASDPGRTLGTEMRERYPGSDE